MKYFLDENGVLMENITPQQAKQVCNHVEELNRLAAHNAELESFLEDLTKLNIKTLTSAQEFLTWADGLEVLDADLTKVYNDHLAILYES